NERSIEASPLHLRNGIIERYGDVLTPATLHALAALAHFNTKRQRILAGRSARRAARLHKGRRINFLDDASTIAGTEIAVSDARAGKFVGSAIPADLQRQWIQGTGPAARPRATVEESLRNVAYALLSGADGWMFDGEDALGQVSEMSLDNQRSLKLA